MLPQTRMAVGSSGNGASDGQLPDYFRRLLDFKQMDFESTFDQMIYLLSPDPEKAFKNFYYRKRTYFPCIFSFAVFDFIHLYFD
jgi:hypothetical protein